MGTFIVPGTHLLGQNRCQQTFQLLVWHFLERAGKIIWVTLYKVAVLQIYAPNFVQGSFFFKKAMEESASYWAKILDSSASFQKWSIVLIEYIEVLCDVPFVSEDIV